MNKASELADSLNNKLDQLHDQIVSDNPFSWSDSEQDQKKREALFREITEKLTTFIYVPKTGTITKILLFGTALPLMLLGILYLSDIPAEDTRIFVWGGLAVIAAVSAITAAVIADDPNIGSDLALAAYTVPRGWSFSRMHGKNTWEEYHKRFSYFKQGDEDQNIQCRIWGCLDAEPKRPFQLFHFYFETVYYTTHYTHDAKGNITGSYQVKHEVPHHRYGMFIAMPESKVRFRLTEVGGDAGLDSRIKLEFGALNEAVDIFCDEKDELAVRQFLSPAVQETVMKLSKDLEGMHVDFYPGLVLFVTHNNFLNQVAEIELDENTSKFTESVRPAGDEIEKFRGYLLEGFNQIKKYNDNY